MSPSAKWKTTHPHLERELTASLGRRAAGAWLQEAAGLRFLLIEPRHLSGCDGILSIAAGRRGTEDWYLTLGVHTSGLLEIREGPAADFALDAGGQPLQGLVLADVLLQRLMQGPASAETLAEMVEGTARKLASRITGKCSSAAIDAFEAYQAEATNDARRVARRASRNLLRRLPEWIAIPTRRVPLPSSLEAINWILDPVDGPRRSQALLTYPSAAPALVGGAARRAIDAGRPLSMVLVRELELNRAQVDALRSPLLAAAACALLDTGRVNWPDLIAAIRAMPGKLMPFAQAALEAGALNPVGWARLGQALQRFPNAATLIDGAPWIPGFCDDGRWTRESAAVQRLGTLRDTVDWLRKAIFASLPVRYDNQRRRLLSWVDQAVDAFLQSLKPPQLARLDDELHALVVELRGKAPVLALQLPLLTANGAVNGIRYRQLRSMGEYAEEGAAMHHCVATYFSLAREGRYVAYAIESPDRATLGLRMSMTNHGSLKDPVWMMSASLEQVRGPGNAALPKAYTEFGEAMARRLTGGRLPAESVAEFQRAQSARSRRESDEWKFPFHELLRERMWRRLPAAMRGSAAGFREALIAEIERRRPPKAERRPPSLLDKLLPDERLPEGFDSDS